MQPLSLRELEWQARQRLDPAIYDFFAGGADDELTLRANESAFAGIQLLPRVLRERREPKLVDGGIRRGTDVVKALALGASAVAIGRPVLWGLAVAGEDGVSLVLEMLCSELLRALVFCGCGSLNDVTCDLVHVRRSGER